MKFFHADSCDAVDPGYDFINDASNSQRNRQLEDRYAHEVMGEAPYDGILLSRSVLMGSGNDRRYSHGQRLRMEREGVASFFRLSENSVPPIPVMGDCGAFAAFRSGDELPSTEELVEYYERLRFTYGVSPDYLITEYNRSWDKKKHRPKDVEKRARMTFESARDFADICRKEKATFKPIGVIQSWSPRSAVDYARRLVDIGYTYVGLGGMVGRRTEEIHAVVSEIRSSIAPDIDLHIFGFCRFDRLEEFHGLGVTSFDSTSPMIKAFKDERYNYFLPDGRKYIAIKLPSALERKTRNNIHSGAVDVEKLRESDLSTMKALRNFQETGHGIETVLDELDRHSTISGVAAGKRTEYRRTLTDRPWDRCDCPICITIGIDVILYRGLNRNKRRGFHNLYALHKRLKIIRSKKSIRIPCLRTKQNPNKEIFSFIINGKDIPKVASVSRVSRSAANLLEGYQRSELTDHISDIRKYLKQKDSTLVNSIVIAFDSSIRFEPAGQSSCEFSEIGTVELPIGDKNRSGWIVDGQQRVAAIRQLERGSYPVSVIAFESATREEEMEQFVLVNSAKPLPKSLVYELLPGLGNRVPDKYVKYQKASRLLERLNWDDDSPFFRRIRTTTTRHIETANIKDTSVLKMIQNSMTNGALSKFGDADEKSMKFLKNYWAAVYQVYGSDWEVGPKKSRLTHGVGIVSMGYLMDTIAFRVSNQFQLPPKRLFEKELRRITLKLPWSYGVWEFSNEIRLPWNEIQNISRHVELVTNFIIRIYSVSETSN